VKGHAEAQLWIAFLYQQGDGVEKNLAVAAGWYKKAAAQGMATALFNLGTFYETGTGVPQDTAMAANLYLDAADRGFVDAQAALGRMFADGVGIRQDLVRAHKWLNLAAAAIEPGKARDQIISQREIVARHLTAAQLAEAQRRAREWRPQAQ
jgi:TPR repeat protein